MKYIRLIFLISMLVIFNTSCNKNKNRSNQGTEQPDKPGLSVFEKDININNELSQKIIGFWQNVKSDIWIEFRADGTYKVGKGNKLSKKALKYKINEKDSTITLQTRKRIKEFPFSFSGNVLIIQQDKGEFRYVKIDKKPTN